MAARKSANAAGVRRIKAVFVKEPLDGGNTFKYFRQPFNLVEYDWGNGERTTGLEICPGNRFRSYTGDQAECYDEVMIVTPAELNNWPAIDRWSGYTR